jgi:uroporphyrin-III C-methyltransferase/precorrin-2 dehydrogenase/sirohydrochlorin ferrochelatase
MGAGQAGPVARTLIARGRAADTPVAVVRDASLPGSTTRTGTLGDLAALCAPDGADGTTPGPAVILLGKALRAAVAIGEPEQRFLEARTHAFGRQSAG